MNPIRRIIVLAAGVSGLLALVATTANAYIVGNHCEPLRQHR